MNHFVPDFEMDEDDTIPTSTGFTRPNHKTNMQEDELMEMLWQNGQVVLQSQNQRSSKKSSSPPKFHLSGESTAKNNLNPPCASTTMATDELPPPPYQLFMQEDEMASWLQYPLEDEDNFGSDLLYPPPSSSNQTMTHSKRVFQIPSDHHAPSPPRPPIPPGRRTELAKPDSKFERDFIRSTRLNAESQPSVSAVRESTVVGSCETPTVRLLPPRRSNGTATMEKDRETAYDLTMTSSSGGSGGCNTEPSAKPPSFDRKRKAREDDDGNDDEEEDAKCEASDTKKQSRGSASARRSRAAEVHNLSERRRRDRINEKMKALQELIPRCNKSDKASMLDEAIEYLKSLQLQVQMMSMGCSMVPMMFPGVHPYMLPMGMGMGMNMGMGMGMGMDVGLNRPMMPFQQVVAGSSMPRAAGAAHLAPRLPLPAFNVPSGSSPNVSAMCPNQSDPSLNPIGIRSPNPMQAPFSDPYQRYLSHYNMQATPCPPQIHSMAQASTSKGVESHENQKLG